MRDDQVRSSQAPLYGSESSVTINGASPSPGRPEQHQTMLQTKPVAATTSSQWAYPRSPYPSSLLSLYNGLLSSQSEPDLFDLMHRPQATCVHLPEEDKELYTSSNTDFVVLSNIPAERFMNPFQRVYYQSRHLFSSPVIPTSVHQTPNGSIRRVQQSHVTQTALPSGVQSSKFLPDPKQDPVKHPHLTQVLNEEEQGKKKSGGEAGRGPGYTSSSAISSISQLLTAPEKNNNIPGSTGAQQNSHRRECVKCGVLFTPILELNGSKQLLCNSCGVIPPIRTASPDVRATPSPARGSPSPSPYKDKKKQMYPQRIDAVCSNCKTSNTSLWRRNHTGETVCNACGLYYKLHGVARPISMRKDGAIIRRRKNNKMVSVGD